MKANRTIWNKLAIALSGILLIWLIAPRQDCFCAETAVTVLHGCCPKSENAKCQAISSTVFQNESCCCSDWRASFSESQLSNAWPEIGPAQTSMATLTRGMSASNDQRRLLRLAELQNHELKPSKIFLLKRAFLN